MKLPYSNKLFAKVIICSLLGENSRKSCTLEMGIWKKTLVWFHRYFDAWARCALFNPQNVLQWCQKLLLSEVITSVTFLLSGNRSFPPECWWWLLPRQHQPSLAQVWTCHAGTRDGCTAGDHQVLAVSLCTIFSNVNY